MATLVEYEPPAEGVARIRLNRPGTSNSLDSELLRELHDAILRAHSDHATRAVVLTGAGKNFCAGGDVKTFLSKGEALPDYLRDATAWLQTATAALLRLKAPVIAGVQGFAAGGGGLGLVCASDFVVATRSAKFFSGAVRVGMAPDGGVSVSLSRIVGLRRAMDILIRNPTLTAEDACQIGLINEVVDDGALEDRLSEFASEIAALAPAAVAATKRLIWDGLGATVEERLGEEARVVSQLSGTADSREGLAAVVDRRAPRFTGE